MKYILLLCLVLSAGFVSANTSDFNINLLVGDDTVPPSTPEFTAVTPVATTQINLSWSTSTDNYLLGGYVLLRDSVHLATTTLTSYIDAGLVASTTYTYEVYAFDSFFNLSSTSVAVATTTLSLPPVVATSTSSSTTPATNTGSRSAEAKSFSLKADNHSAMIVWETYRPTRFILRWGRDEDYDGGYIVNEVYLTDHKTLISDLEPGTKYYYELVAVYPNGTDFVVSRGDFKTNSLVEEATPENVKNLQATVVGEDVRLFWADETNVKIVRNSRFVGSDPYDGVLVFSGVASEFLDKGALSSSRTQFYTVFVVGVDGSLSSGAVVRVDRDGIKIIEKTDTEGEGPKIEEEIIIPDFYLSDVRFYQGGTKVSLAEEEIIFLTGEAILFSIPKESLPRHLKSILVSLTDPSDPERSQVFLARLNKLGSAYEAVIPPFVVGGYSKVKVEIFDYERNTVGRYVKMVKIIGKETGEAEVFFPDGLIKLLKQLAPIFLLGLLIWYWLWRRRSISPTEDNL